MENKMHCIRKAGWVCVYVIIIFSVLALISSQHAEIMSKQKEKEAVVKQLVVMEPFATKGCGGSQVKQVF